MAAMDQRGIDFEALSINQYWWYDANRDLAARIVRVHDDARREVAVRVIPPILIRSEEHTSELQSHSDLVCRLLLEKKKKHYIDDLPRTHQALVDFAPANITRDFAQS